MKTLPISRYRFFQKLQPLSLLQKITSPAFTGCLQVFSANGAWSIYMEEGKLTYACYSEQMFEPLYRNLQTLSQQISTLPRGINEQLKVIFEKEIENQAIPNPDYLAICWLVNQKYISKIQAAVLIERLAVEVLESFLELEVGSYEFIPETFLDDLPKFCHLNLRLLVEQYQAAAKVVPNQANHTVRENHPQPTNNYQATKLSDYKIKHQTKPLVCPPSTTKKVYNIFCIDDNATVLETIKGFLDEEIFSVIALTDSSQALMEILRVKPALILLDVVMPHLDGYEVCSLLRKHTYFKNTPVILMTETSSLRDKAKAKMVKATGYLQKPFTQGDLLKILFHHMV
ncbi:response regulator receiver protein PatA [Richelia sinica FACHB-800]|uniref:Response regulator receiver protein PatA n=1 Tax=Richelia sinica FACHB-800 TaxID=1357546 RepID=A0A975T8T7_9NOST|nr:response regulator [Richelia sinica]MBD2665754.1 response regulator [Richelia sinica FACHB-800]QXE23567.1 response regulator receiver protein PatA [Richelia sinica FACHB-800]